MQLKKAIYDKHSIEPDNQSLHYRDKILGAHRKDRLDDYKDQQTLDDYGLDGIEGIFITQRLHGG